MTELPDKTWVKRYADFGHTINAKRANLTSSESNEVTRNGHSSSANLESKPAMVLRQTIPAGQLLIDGTWREARDRATMVTSDPTTEEIITTVARASPADVEDAIDAAHLAGMIIAPCSVNSMSEIANGITRNLLTRAADVVLKERRRLVLLVRESPLTLTHMRNMLAITECGGIIAPPVPAFYGRAKEIEEIVDHTAGRTLDLFGIDTGGFRRWDENARQQAAKSEAPVGGLECVA